MKKHPMNIMEITPKVSAEWSLLAIAANILKLHHKSKNDRLGTGLVIPKGFPVGL